MTIMTTNATPSAPTATATTEKEQGASAKSATSVPPASAKQADVKSEVKVESAPAATVKPAEPKPEVKTEVKAAPVKPVETAKPAEAVKPVEERLTFNKEKFAQYKLVRMYLLKGGRIQYDPQYPELILNTSDPRGKLLPLTPFFKSRIGVTLDIVL